ncbi:MAG: hypothetical protein PHV34_19950 [Verrucomicrobiae bacterium]|nr:hypothetical protein [Verrucomicrobiae bacterium]
MTYFGKISHGTVLLPSDAALPDGMEVEVQPVEKISKPSLGERLKSFIGMADDLPSDLAQNLDHYLHQQDKK